MCKRQIGEALYRLAQKKGGEGLMCEVKPGMTVSDVLEGRCDILFTAADVSDPRLDARTSIRGSTVPLASPRYLSLHGEPADPGDLTGHDGIIRSADLFPPSAFLTHEETGRRQACRWRNLFVFSDMEAIRDAVLAERGISIDLPVSMFLSDLREGRLVPILRHWRRDSWTYSVVFARDNPRAALLGKIAGRLAAEVGAAFERDRSEAFRLIEAYWRRRGSAAEGACAAGRTGAFKNTD